MRVIICVPTRDEVKAGFAFALANLVQASVRGATPFDIKPLNCRSANIATARNRLAAMALAQNADALLWLDSDLVFPASTLIRLAAHDAAIVGASFARRSPLSVDTDSPIAAHRELPPLETQRANGLRTVEALPFGCVLIKAQVFATLPKPWFAWDEQDSEAYYFCRHARAHGFSTWLDPALSHVLAHLGEYDYRLEAQKHLPTYESKVAP